MGFLQFSNSPIQQWDFSNSTKNNCYNKLIKLMIVILKNFPPNVFMKSSVFISSGVMLRKELVCFLRRSHIIQQGYKHDLGPHIMDVGNFNFSWNDHTGWVDSGCGKWYFKNLGSGFYI